MKRYRLTVHLAGARTPEIRELEADTIRVDESGALHLIRDGQSVIIYADGFWHGLVDVGAMMSDAKATRENPGRVQEARPGQAT